MSIIIKEIRVITTVERAPRWIDPDNQLLEELKRKVLAELKEEETLRRIKRTKDR